MATSVHIDGFNLYYGALKDTQYRWLDVSKLSALLLPGDQIDRIKYFTAIVKALPRDPDQPNRQRLYLRALATIPNLDIFYGSFLSHKVWMPRADSPGVHGGHQDGGERCGRGSRHAPSARCPPRQL